MKIVWHLYKLISFCIFSFLSAPYASCHARRSASRSSKKQRRTYSRISNPSIGLHESGGTKVLVLIPPIGWTRCRATCAEDTFIQTVEFLAVLGGLKEFAWETSACDNDRGRISNANLSQVGYRFGDRAGWICIVCKTGSNLARGP